MLEDVAGQASRDWNSPSYDSIKGDTEGIMSKDQIGINAYEMILSQERY